MGYIPKFYLDEVIRGTSHTLHPAFVVNGKELDGIYVSKIQNVVIDGCAHSLPDRDPAVHKEKGRGSMFTGFTPETAETYKRPKIAPDAALAPYFAWRGCIECTVEEEVSPALFGPALGQRAAALLEKLIPLYEYFYRFTL